MEYGQPISVIRLHIVDNFTQFFCFEEIQNVGKSF
jgi:hypothetical protein